MDKSALGWEHHETVEKHASQKGNLIVRAKNDLNQKFIDYSTGFGGKFGVQKDRVDKTALGWEHKEQVEKHSSQTEYKKGFGGKFGIESDRVDKSAVGWNREETEKVTRKSSAIEETSELKGKAVVSNRDGEHGTRW